MLIRAEKDERGSLGGGDVGFRRKGNFMREDDAWPATAIGEGSPWVSPTCVVCDTDSHSCSETRLEVEALLFPAATLSPLVGICLFASRLLNMPKNDI